MVELISSVLHTTKSKKINNQSPSQVSKNEEQKEDKQEPNMLQYARHKEKSYAGRYEQSLK